MKIHSSCKQQNENGVRLNGIRSPFIYGEEKKGVEE